MVNVHEPNGASIDIFDPNTNVAQIISKSRIEFQGILKVRREVGEFLPRYFENTFARWLLIVVDDYPEITVRNDNTTRGLNWGIVNVISSHDMRKWNGG